MAAGSRRQLCHALLLAVSATVAGAVVGRPQELIVDPGLKLFGDGAEAAAEGLLPPPADRGNPPKHLFCVAYEVPRMDGGVMQPPSSDKIVLEARLFNFTKQMQLNELVTAAPTFGQSEVESDMRAELLKKSSYCEAQSYDDCKDPCEWAAAPASLSPAPDGLETPSPPPSSLASPAGSCRLNHVVALAILGPASEKAGRNGPVGPRISTPSPTGSSSAVDAKKVDAHVASAVATGKAGLKSCEETGELLPRPCVLAGGTLRFYLRGLLRQHQYAVFCTTRRAEDSGDTEEDQIVYSSEEFMARSPYFRGKNGNLTAEERADYQDILTREDKPRTRFGPLIMVVTAVSCVAFMCIRVAKAGRERRQFTGGLMRDQEIGMSAAGSAVAAPQEGPSQSSWTQLKDGPE